MKIDDFNSLNFLKNLSHLESLVLEGNPISSLPNYKNIIISLLSNLKYLDSKVEKSLF